VEQEESEGRRNFLGFLSWAIGGLLTLAVGIPLIGYVLTPAIRRRKSSQWATLGDLSSFPATGEPEPVQYSLVTQDSWITKQDSRTLYLKIVPGQKPVAFSPICTHLGCGVAWDEKQKKFFCPCHGGVYDINGNVLAGPPPRPLTRLELKMEGGKLLVKG